MPKLHLITLFYAKNLNILENTVHRPHKDTLCTYVSNNKRNIN